MLRLMTEKLDPEELKSPEPGGTREPELTDLLLQHHGALVAFVRIHLGAALRAREETEDLVQSVFRDVLEHPGSFQFQGEKAFRGWLFTRCIHKIQEKARYHQAARRDMRKVEFIDQPDDRLAHYAELCPPSEHLRASEFLESMEKAFEKLDPFQQQAIALSRIAKLSYREIASIMNRSEEGVRTLVHRGLARLSGYLPKP
jgi:RNA polymerase sigma factor (sigma-70 family)